MKDAAIVPYTRPYVRVVLPSDAPGKEEAAAPGGRADGAERV